MESMASYDWQVLGFLKTLPRNLGTGLLGQSELKIASACIENILLKMLNLNG